jgi:hypothetical protein
MYQNFKKCKNIQDPSDILHVICSLRLILQYLTTIFLLRYEHSKGCFCTCRPLFGKKLHWKCQLQYVFLLYLFILQYFTFWYISKIFMKINMNLEVWSFFDDIDLNHLFYFDRTSYFIPEFGCLPILKSHDLPDGRFHSTEICVDRVVSLYSDSGKISEDKTVRFCFYNHSRFSDNIWLLYRSYLVLKFVICVCKITT